MEHIRKYLTIALLAIIAFMVAGSILPDPYNINYAFKVVFFKATAICSDGNYSFATIPKDMCKGQGRIVERLP